MFESCTEKITEIIGIGKADLFVVVFKGFFYPYFAKVWV